MQARLDAIAHLCGKSRPREDAVPLITYPANRSQTSLCRGMKAVRFAAVMKAIGLNIMRVGRFIKRENSPIQPSCGTSGSFLAFYEFVKEQITRRTRTFFAISKKSQPGLSNWPEMNL